MISNGYSQMSLEDFRKKVSDFEVAHRYLGISKLPTLINSPLRKDESPSFSLYQRPDGIVCFIDFGNGSKGDIYTLLSSIWCTNRKEAIERVIKNFQGAIQTGKTGYRKNHCVLSSLSVITRDWNQDDLDYWESYGINKEWLEFGQVYPISRVLITKGQEVTGLPCDKLAYVYVENKDNVQSLKIYQPLNKKFKWMSKHDSSVWDLWTQLPQTGDNLIITSSRKDALCIWSNTGIPSCSLQGEGMIPKLQVINQLKERFKHVFVLYDNDWTAEENHGRIYGKNIAETFGLTQLELPIEYLSKDTSDLAKKWGRRTVYEVITKLVKDNQ